MPEQGSSEHPYDWQQDEGEQTDSSNADNSVIDIRGNEPVMYETTLEAAMAELDAIVTDAKLQSNGEITPHYIKLILDSAKIRTADPNKLRHITAEYLDYVQEQYRDTSGATSFLSPAVRHNSIELIKNTIKELDTGD